MKTVQCLVLVWENLLVFGHLHLKEKLRDALLLLKKLFVSSYGLHGPFHKHATF